MFRLPRFTFVNLLQFVFHNSPWNSLHVIYLYIFKKCQNFQTENKFKELILGKMSRIRQISHVV